MSEYQNSYKYFSTLAAAIEDYRSKENYLKIPLIVSKDLNSAGAKGFYVTDYKLFRKIYFDKTVKNFYELSHIQRSFSILF